MFLSTILLVFASACTSDGLDGERARECESGFVADGSLCVPSSCGAGRWGELPVSDDSVYVDIAAEEGGDGTEEAPFRAIQPAIDHAGAVGGALVAVAAGTYPETLAFRSDHAEVHLAGRCREMTILDASVGMEGTPGIEIDVGAAAVDLAGVTVSESSEVGLVVASGDVTVRDAAITGSASYGVHASRSGDQGTTGLVMEGCLIERSREGGIFAGDPGTEVALSDTVVRDTRPNAMGDYGWGIEVVGGAAFSVEGGIFEANRDLGVYAGDPGTELILRDTTVKDTHADANERYGWGIYVEYDATLLAEGCLIEGSTEGGVFAGDPGTEVTLRDTVLKDTRPSARGEYGWGIEARSGATFIVEGGIIEGNADLGVYAGDSGTHVTLRDTTVRDTLPNTGGEHGRGINVQNGAALTAEGCLIEGNTDSGVFATDPGTEVTLRNLTIRGTQSNGNGEFGWGIQVFLGATLSTEGCVIEGNTDLGVFASDSGTEIILQDTLVKNTRPNANGERGRGVEVHQLAHLSADDCVIEGNSEIGLAAYGPGAQVILRGTTVRDTQPNANAEYGRGIDVEGDATLSADDCVIEGNTNAGVFASSRGTMIDIRDSTISNTLRGANLMASTASGLTVQLGASVSASRLFVASNQGPGILASLDSAAECIGCTIQDNQFAGVVAIMDGTLTITDSTITGTMPGANLLGGAGVYAWPWGEAPPTILLTNTLIQDNPVAGVWLIGNGTYMLRGNIISGGIGESFGSGSRCGDAILALDGVTAWDGASGLLLQDNVFQEAFGSGVFLDASSAWMSGNTYSGNTVDLVVQNQSCDAIPVYYSEAPRRDSCPAYSYPTCNEEFFYVAMPADPVE